MSGNEIDKSRPGTLAGGSEDPQAERATVDVSIGPADDPLRLEFERKRILRAKIDPERFDYLYDYYYERIFRFFYHRTLSRTAAEDLTSDTFHAALRGLGRYRWQNKPFQAWLYGIATNRLKKHFEAQRKRPVEPLPTNILGEDVLVDSAEQPAERLERHDERERMMRALAELEPEDQDWLTLYYFEEMTAREIAEIAGVPVGTMKARIHRALAKLRRLLGADDA